MDAIDLTGSGSDDDDPKRSSSSSVGFSAYAAQPSSAGFATASGSGSGSGSGATGAAGRAGAVNPSISTSTSPKAHRPPNSQQQSLPSSSSSHTHHASSSSTSLPASATIHSSTPTTNNVHRTASSASASGSGSNSASASGYPQFSGVAKSTPATTARGDEDDVMVTGQSGPSISPASARPSGSYGAMLGAASAAAHHQSQPSQPFFSPSFYSNGAGPSSSSSSDPPIAGPSNSHTHSRHDDGSTAAAAIDVDSLPPAPPSRRPNPKKPVCIGAFMSRAIMLYPQSCAMAGCGPPAGSKWDLVNFRGVEMIRVKLKLRRAGTTGRPNEPWTTVSRDTIQVLTPDMRCYIGDLDETTASHLIPMLERGLCRLEGFALRLQPNAPTYEIRINVMIFTLPSNISYIVDTLMSHKIFLLDPMPPYDPSRHTDHPEYINGHGSGEIAYKLYLQSRSSQTYGYTQQDKAKQVEVQRAQVDEVFKSIDNGMELEQTDPGPWIKTELFPHQRKALTFLLQGEQDWSSLRAARRSYRKLVGSKDKVDGGDKSRSSTPGEKSSEKDKAREKEKEDNLRSLWEGQPDEKGRIRVFKNKVTGETVRGKRPKDAKGAILADDMGLGKTLSVVSLIAATRSAANLWHEKKLEALSPVSDDENDKPELPASVMTTKVFGMPEGAEVVEGSKSKKRRRDKEVDEWTKIRRSQLTRRSKATLLVCPMSTITNWEDQLREHWDGKVEVIGGQQTMERKKKDNKPVDKDDLLRVYIYHGTSRRADPRFLAEFDVVITSYATLANEYSKQCATLDDDTSTPATHTTTNSDDDTKDSSCASPAKPGTGEPPKPLALAQALNQTKKKGGRRKGAPEPSPLQSIDWFRVVLDEAHSIKSSQTVACKACCYLEADRRIALTGTPIQNRIEDVWALFKFLRLSPIDDKEVFNKYITTPCKTGEQIGIARLQLIMRTCSLRRTKDTETEEGKKILSLPPRREIQAWLELRDDERAIYQERLNEIKKEVDELQAKKELTKNYAHVLQHLLRLRQTCNHVDLAGSAAAEDDYNDGEIMGIDDALAGIERHGLTQGRALAVICAAKDNDTCVCLDCGHDFSPYFPSVGLGGAEDDTVVKAEEAKPEKGKKNTHPLLTKCLHIFCPSCFRRNTWPQWPKGVKGVMRHCAKCSRELRMDKDVADVIPPSELDEEAAKRPAPTRRKWRRQPGEHLIMSTKMQYLHDELMKLSRLNKHSANYDPFGAHDQDGIVETDDEGNPIPTKSIVFSQWTTMLDRIEDMLQESNIRFCRLDGSMTREARAEAMEQLKTKGVEVMLVSTRAGGVGLNLTSASRAFLVDPYWNPSVEAQAIDRIHRLGQKRPVLAVKLMIKDSVEERLDKIQRKKQNLANLSLRNMTRKELMEQKAEELASLFS